ncbi:MAG: class I SAM-dependent methyltransferase [Gammaproteobacteria bacterium]|nr:class I SAM-dependent methyltransferase [Gammaproteobacteria bacterium]MDH3465708.1 class I SAM-dependent methyltransferase [Gammaproteobacteria bacterium]
MSVCCGHAQSAGRFFSFFAKRYRKRFDKKGFEPAQRLLLAGLDRIDLTDATVLEIGSGVGHLHQTLLERGAESAVGVDLAPKMLAEAQTWADERGLSERVEYIEGDFMTPDFDPVSSDLCLLDKVVCCYPDARGLIGKSLSKTKRVYALIYPRDRWFMRAGFATVSFGLWLLRSEFRPYVHDPQQIERWITDSGFAKQREDRTVAWLVQIYVKQ